MFIFKYTSIVLLCCFSLLLLSTACTTPSKISKDPVEPKEIDLSSYFDPYEEYRDLRGYVPPRAKDLNALLNSVEYPDKARKRGIEGSVTLRLYIDRTGVVRQVVIEESLSESIDKSARNSALQAKFYPATINGQAVSAIKKKTFTYTLNR